MKFRLNSRKRRLASRLRFFFLFIILFMIIAIIASVYFIIRNERREYVLNESKKILSGLSDSISSDMQRYKELSRLIMIDNRVVTFLRADTKDVDQALINTARYGALGILNVTSLVDSVFIFRNDFQYMANNRGKYNVDFIRMKDDKWYNNIIEKKGRVIISLNADNALFKMNGVPIITISRAIHDVVTQYRTGILLMNISVELFEQKIDHLDNSDIFIISTDGTFLAGNRTLAQYFNPSYTSENFVYEEINVENDDLFVSGIKIPEMPFVVMSVSQIKKGIISGNIVAVMIFFLIVLIVTVLMAFKFISKNIARPVLELTEAMEKNRQEGTLEKIDIDIPNFEIGMLEDSYNNMVDHMNYLFDSLIEKEQTIQKAEMRVLHEQIKPHFLYNSLETIGFLALDAGADKVHLALETLGSFYRNFLSKGSREIPLEREIAIIKDYLSLQKLRYGEILNDEYDIEEKTKGCIIPKLILQPLVENSIYHGIRMKGEQGIIKISSRLKEDGLHILVHDTGIGMTEEQIEQVLSTEKDVKFDNHSESFGLWGTIERIRCYYEKNDIVKIRSIWGEYTEIEFILPVNK